MKKILLVAAVLVLAGFACSLGGDSVEVESSPIVEVTRVVTQIIESEVIGEVAGEIMYACGIDRCKDSGEYGKLIYASGINVWEIPGPNRKVVNRQLNHLQEVTVLLERRLNDGPGGLWYGLSGGGWINDLWLTEKPCNYGNIEKDSFKDCLMGEY